MISSLKGLVIDGIDIADFNNCISLPVRRAIEHERLGGSYLVIVFATAKLVICDQLQRLEIQVITLYGAGNVKVSITSRSRAWHGPPIFVITDTASLKYVWLDWAFI
jgi:hypothetical protein